MPLSKPPESRSKSDPPPDRSSDRPASTLGPRDRRRSERTARRRRPAGIRVYAIKGSWRLDETIRSRIIAMAFSMAAEIERDPVSARTKEAIRARKASGRPKGPGKSKLDPFRPEIEALRRNACKPLKLDEEE